MSDDLPPALQGPTLRDALTHQRIERPPLIEGFVHEGTTLMVASDAGVGKSTLFIQLAAQASIGQTVFGLFPCVRPLTIYYLMSERDQWEPVERLKRIEPQVAFDDTRLIIDAGCVGLTLTNATHRQTIFSRILARAPDVVALDPIYGFFEGGMAGDEVAIRIARFCTLLIQQAAHPMGIILWHHNVKHTKQLDATGKWTEKDSPFYGSQFFKAHVTGYYDLASTKYGTFWRRKKDTYGVLHPDFGLLYDVATGLSHPERASLDSTTLDKRDQFRLFLQQKAKVHQPFKAQEVLEAIPMTSRYLRFLLSDPEFSPLLKAVSVNGHMVTFEVLSSG